LGVGQKEFDLAIETNSVRLAVGHVAVKNFACGVDGRAFGEAVAVGNELPVFT
jgi:hypothetical protein